MKIVIAGAGEVGKHLAKLLSNEEQDIIIMDTDERRLASLDNYNLLTHHGSATSIGALQDVRIGSADLFIAVTPSETANLIACQLAKNKGAARTVARIDNAEFLQRNNLLFFSQIGIDHLVYPEYLAAQEMRTSLQHTWVRNWFEMLGGQLIVVGVKVRANATFVGKQLKDIGPVAQFMHVSAIKRNREIIIPRGFDRILDGDIVYIATTRPNLERVAQACGKRNINVQKLLVMGGGKITEQLVRMIGEDYRVKVIEPDMDRCRYLVDRLPDCVVINGDASDTDLLEEEGISDHDVFAALSDRSEANILGCLMAKEHGVPKTIAQVENLQYINEAEALNIGSLINKKLLAAGRIFQIMLDADVDNSKCLALSDAEVAELVVREKSRLTKSPVKDLRLPEGMTIAGLVRDGTGQLVRGDTQLLAGDHVVVFCLSGAIHKIEKTFS